MEPSDQDEVLTDGDSMEAPRECGSDLEPSARPSFAALPGGIATALEPRADETDGLERERVEIGHAGSSLFADLMIMQAEVIASGAPPVAVFQGDVAVV